MQVLIAIGILSISLLSAASSHAADCFIDRYWWTCGAELHEASGYTLGGTDARSYGLGGSCTEHVTWGKCHKDLNLNHCLLNSPLKLGKSLAEYDPKTGRARFQGPILGTLDRGSGCPDRFFRFPSSGYIDEEYSCPADPWITPGVECKLLVPDQRKWRCDLDQACPPFGGLVSKQEAFQLSQESAIDNAAANAHKLAQEEKLRRARLEKSRVLNSKDGLTAVPATRLQQPGRARSSMERNIASVGLAPPLILQPKPGAEPGDRLKIEIRGQTQASKKYEIEIEGHQGDWKRLYQRSLGADPGGVARFELTLSQLGGAENGMEWRLRSRGQSPQTPWSGWVPFRTAALAVATPRLKQPMAAPAPAPRGRLKLPIQPLRKSE